MKIVRLAFFVFLMIQFVTVPYGLNLDLPPRADDALSGSQFVLLIIPMSLQMREETIFNNIQQGNIPDFLRTLCPVTVSQDLNGQSHTITYYVTADYLAIGSNSDYFLCPMTPTLGQRIADLLLCNLPTTKMVDDIYGAAAVKLEPQPIAPSPEMTTVPVFNQHNAMVWQQRSDHLASHPLGALVGGDKKDVVVTNQLQSKPGKVAIYGWHQLNGIPIQPLYLGHSDTYVDYSHGIRLAHLDISVDGTSTTITSVLADPALAALLSKEGTILIPRYPVDSPTPTPTPTPTNLVLNGSFEDGFTNGVGNFWHSWTASGSNPIMFGTATINIHDGLHAQYWARSDSQVFEGGIFQNIAVSMGQNYRIQAWLKRQSILNETFMAFGYDLSGGTNGKSPSVIYTDLTGAIDNVWVQYDQNVAASGSSITLFSNAGHHLTSGGTSAFFYIDEVSMVPLEAYLNSHVSFFY